MTISLEPDLQAIFDSFNSLYFDSTLNSEIRWGRKYSKARRRTIRLGSYNFKNDVIRINPVFASGDIPDVVLRYVVYHEMAHAWCIKNDPQMRFHNGVFKQKERAFPEYKQAQIWLNQNKTKFFASTPARSLWTLFR